MTSEMGEDLNALKKERAEKRALNRDSSADYLEKNGIKFESKNFGAHLILAAGATLIDFYPGTGRWTPRNFETRFGVKNLVKFIKERITR